VTVPDTRTRLSGLSEEAQDVVWCLGALSGIDVDVPMAAAVCGIDAATAVSLLTELSDADVLQPLGADQGEERLCFPELVRAEAQRRAAVSGREEEGLWRWVGWLLDWATAAQKVLAPFDRTLPRTYRYRPADPAPFLSADTQTAAPAAWAWLTGHRAMLKIAVQAAAEACARPGWDQAGWRGAVWQLVDATGPLHERQPELDFALHAHQLGLAAAERLGDYDPIARMLLSGGRALCMAGRVDEAVMWCRRALALATEDRDTRTMGEAERALGNIALDEGLLDLAEDHDQRAWERWSAIDYRRGLAVIQEHLGDIATRRHTPHIALDYLAQARAGFLAQGDTLAAARVQARAGFAVGRLDNGARRAEGMAQLEVAIGELTCAAPLWAALAWEMHGQLAHAGGDRAQAGDSYLAALNLLAEGHPRYASRVLGRLRGAAATGHSPRSDGAA
jgi:tetratricopeptide (TPR) repeat protein